MDETPYTDGDHHWGLEGTLGKWIARHEASRGDAILSTWQAFLTITLNLINQSL
jgi:hypothetical protein